MPTVLLSQSKEKRLISYVLLCNHSKMILWVSSLAWTQAGWFLLLVLPSVTIVAVVIWTVDGWSKVVASLLLVVGDDCRLGLFLLVLSHPLWAFTVHIQAPMNLELQQCHFFHIVLVKSKSQIQLRSSGEIGPTSLLEEKQNNFMKSIYWNRRNLYLFLFIQHFWKIFSLAAKLKGFHSEYPYAYQLDCTVNIFLYSITSIRYSIYIIFVRISE